MSPVSVPDGLFELAATYIPWWEVCLAAILFAWLFFRSHERLLLRPVFALPVILIVYPIIGLFNLAAIQLLAGWYEGVDGLEVTRLVYLGTIAMIGVMICGNRAPVVIRQTEHFSADRLKRWALGGTVFGALLNIPNFIAIGGLPILWKDLTGFERFELGDQLVLGKVLLFSSAMVTLNILVFMEVRPFWRPNVVLTVVNLILASAIGSRHLILLPVVVAGLYWMFSRRVSARTVLLGLGSLAFASLVFQILRGDDYGLNFLSMVSAFGMEYRDFVLLRDYFHFADFQWGTTIVPIVTNVIPKQLFALLGLDKAEFAVYSAFIAQDVWGSLTGVRLGVWGELFMNWGDAGIVVGLPVFGWLVLRLDRALRGRMNQRPLLLFLSFVYSMFLFSLIGSWATIGDTIQVHGVFYFLVYRLLGEHRSGTIPSESVPPQVAM